MNLQQIRDAAKVDILTFLSKDAPGVFEFRHIENLAKLVTDILDSNGEAREHRQIEDAIRESELRYPTLHEALLGRAFDGEGLLRAKYAELQAHHKKLRVAKLGVEDAASRVNIELEAIAVGKKVLKAHAESLERERERLGLLAQDAGVEITLPDIPALPAVLKLEDGEEEAP